jgi:mercuric ion binding protein
MQQSRQRFKCYIAACACLCFIGSTTQVAFAQEQTVQMHISGMTCGICPITIQHRAMQMKGVHAVHIDLKHAQARMTYDDQQQSPQAIAKVITTLGYPTTYKEKNHE